MQRDSARVSAATPELYATPDPCHRHEPCHLVQRKHHAAVECEVTFAKCSGML